MSWYRKKPVVVEAQRVDELMRCARGDWKALPRWVEEAYDVGLLVFAADGISVKTLEGTMLAQRGDWLLRGVKGELYPCKPDIFELTYEPVRDDDISLMVRHG